MQAIEFNGARLMLHHAGLMFWPKHQLAVVSDLHLEKGSFFAQTGQLLPAYDSVHTLIRLQQCLQSETIKRLMFLGDSFHDRAGYHRLQPEALALFNQLCDTYQILWVMGNHEAGFVPPGVEASIEITIDGLNFRHICTNNADAEISGHYHPKVSLRIAGKRVNRACFMHSDQRLIMPAFGAFTGGLRVDSSALTKLFPRPHTLHVLGSKAIFSLPSEQIEHA